MKIASLTIVSPHGVTKQIQAAPGSSLTILLNKNISDGFDCMQIRDEALGICAAIVPKRWAIIIDAVLPD